MSVLYRAGLAVSGVVALGDLSAPLLADGEVLAGVAIGLTVVGTALVLAGLRRPVPAVAR